MRERNSIKERTLCRKCVRVWVVETEEESVELSVCGCACMCVGVRGGPFVSLCVSACVCLYEWSSLKCCRMSSKLITSILSSPLFPLMSFQELTSYQLSHPKKDND